MMRLPPLPALRAFEAAARHGSFTLAAQELCVTTGAVSRQVRLLERHLEMPLFARHHRKVVLTAAGQRYRQTVSTMFAELIEAGAALARDAQQTTIRIDCVPTLAMYWLTPRLADYHGAHPGIRIDTTTGLGPLDPAAPFDLAIRRDPRHFAGLHATPFMQEHCAPLCSAGFAARHDLSSPENMLRAPTVGIRAREDLWQTWSKRHGLRAPPPARQLTLDHTFAALQAAEDGLGVVMAPTLFAQRQLAAGRLLAPFPGMAVESGRYYLLTRTVDAYAGLRAWLLRQGADQNLM